MELNHKTTTEQTEQSLEPLCLPLMVQEIARINVTVEGNIDPDELAGIRTRAMEVIQDYSRYITEGGRKSSNVKAKGAK